MTTTATDRRTEHDLLGEMTLPADTPWGIHTARALDNFAVSGRPVNPALIRAYIDVKRACCNANAELGYLPDDISKAITSACDVASTLAAEAFPVDALQGGAGTSTNMNVNEVIAHQAMLQCTRAGHTIMVHPLEHVNLHQSTNDTYPTALKIAAIRGVHTCADAIASLQGALQRREQAFAAISTLGRTELMPAVPMTLGSQFGAMAEAIGRDRWRTFKCEERLRVVNIGGTAVGTGLTAPRRYIFLVIEKLREQTGLGLTRGENVPGETANADVFVEVSGIMKAAAVNLMKVARDLRDLHARGEINLPAVQAGSSLMPGKVNPVICEAAIQAAIQLKANDMIVAECASLGSHQIVEFMPLLADALLASIDLLTRATQMLAMHVEAITANEQQCTDALAGSEAIITAIVPVVGYERATALITQYRKAPNGTLRAFLEAELGVHVVEKALRPQTLTALGHN